MENAAEVAAGALTQRLAGGACGESFPVAAWAAAPAGGSPAGPGLSAGAAGGTAGQEPGAMAGVAASHGPGGCWDVSGDLASRLRWGLALRWNSARPVTWPSGTRG